MHACMHACMYACNLTSGTLDFWNSKSVYLRGLYLDPLGTLAPEVADGRHLSLDPCLMEVPRCVSSSFLPRWSTYLIIKDLGLKDCVYCGFRGQVP